MIRKQRWTVLPWFTEATVKRSLKIFVSVILVALLVELVFVYIYQIKKDLKISGHRTTNKREHIEEEFTVADNDLGSLYKNRVQHIKEVCRSKRTPELNEKTYKRHFYCVLEGFNVSYCKVPKSGSTMWVQISAVLKYGAKNIDTFLNKARKELHRNKTCTDTLKKLSKFKTKTVLVSRDPYSRLYSAFIDKSFLYFLKANNSISRPQLNNCSLVKQVFNQSFQQFLDKALAEIRNKSSNPHWTPIFSLCNPCYADIFLHVKLEEFSKDIQYVYSQIGFNEELQMRLKKLSTSKLAILTGIAATIFKRHLSAKCRTSNIVAERLWVSFQLQGYIREESEFPEELFVLYCRNTTNSPTEIFMRLVSRELTLNPLSRDDAYVQRHKALVYAYSTVRPDTVSAIQQLFKMDFLMFSYSMTPPN